MSINKAALALLLPSLAAARAPAVDRAQYVMGTVCEIRADGPRAGEAVAAAFAELSRWDRLLSLYKEDSELSAVNRRAGKEPVRVSESFWEALTQALLYAERTGGAFDPTILPAIRRGPSALPLVGYARVLTDPKTRRVRFARDGMALDFGGIGKGLALDHAARALRERGVRSALLNFGGQVYALGAPPGEAGWTVRLPDGRKAVLRDASVSTSGNEERPGHIVSPVTGLPVLNRPPVTVVAPTGTEADGWDTALFVLGSSKPYPGCAVFSGRKAPPACSPYLARTSGAQP